MSRRERLQSQELQVTQSYTLFYLEYITYTYISYVNGAKAAILRVTKNSVVHQHVGKCIKGYKVDVLM